MSRLLDNPDFCASYEMLRQVSLNPQRHMAANAYEHSELVRQRVLYLADRNSCTPDDVDLLSDVALAHDIGKIRGTANPHASVMLLREWGISDEPLIQLVEYHDVNLPWYLSSQRGKPPSNKGWRRLAQRVDVRLLALFMVADRVDCPGGWRENQPLMWFLKEVKNRGLLDRDVEFDDC